MSYGINAPWGLMPVRTISDATWNGKVDTFSIASGYANNIFRGDLVYLSSGTAVAGQAGKIRNLFDFAAAQTQATYAVTPALGVFWGCSFATSTSSNPIDPANPGRMYWPSGQQTLGGVDAVAYVITDPTVVYNIQTGTGTNNGAQIGAVQNGALQSNVGMSAQVQYSFTGLQGTNAQVFGNTQTGQSSLVLDMISTPPARADPTWNLLILGLSANPQNPNTGINTQNLWNNVEVLLQNSYFSQLPSIPAGQ